MPDPIRLNPVLFEFENTNYIPKKIIYATTGLSYLKRGRFELQEDWVNLWNFIFYKLGLENIKIKKFIPVVYPTFNATEPLPSEYARTAFTRAKKWLQTYITLINNTEVCLAPYSQPNSTVVCALEGLL